MKPIFFLFFYLFLTPISAQLDSIEEQVKEAIIEYRNHLLTKNSNPTALRETLKTWNEIEQNDTITRRILYDYNHGIVTYNKTLKNLKKEVDVYYPESALPEKITEVDSMVLKDNFDLISFMSKKYLKNDYPYEINLDT